MNFPYHNMGYVITVYSKMGNNAISALNNATSPLCNATSALSNAIRYVYQAKMYCINDFWFHVWTSSNTLSSIDNFIKLLYQEFFLSLYFYGLHY